MFQDAYPPEFCTKAGIIVEDSLLIGGFEGKMEEL